MVKLVVQHVRGMNAAANPNLHLPPVLAHDQIEPFALLESWINQ